jgi:alkylresorcinol/alkylpyrone synthase
MSRIVAARSAFPSHDYAQSELTAACVELCGARGPARALLERLHASAGVRRRQLAFPISGYPELSGLARSSTAYRQAAVELGEHALRGALHDARLPPEAVDLLLYTSVTGICVPSVDALLATRVGLRRDVKRLPTFGLGCAGGAAGLARVHDYLAGDAGGTAVLLSVELCSLTLHHVDTDPANLVASALFGDGAAAVVLRGGPRPTAEHGAGPYVVASRSVLYPDTADVLGWQVTDTGLAVLIGPGLPGIVRERVGTDVREFLAAHDLKPADVTGWVCHPGGPKVLDALAAALDLPDDALASSWRLLAEHGNMSSASVLALLAEALRGPRPPRGTPGLVLAIGPGLAIEMVLLRW